MKNLKKLSGFTLVELIVVITILVILGTIAFISLGGYAASARDSARIENLGNLRNGLSLYQVKSGTYPIPENYVNITASGTILQYLWFAKDSVGALANISKGGTQDPLDPTIYTTYSTNATQNKMQLMAFLEDGSSVISFIPNSFAATTTDYSKRYPSSKWDSLGILLGNTGSTLNQPVQESGMGVDVVNTATWYLAYFSKSDTVSGTGSSLFANISSRNSEILNSKTLASLDSSLVGWWDMETLSWALLKDLSEKGNNGTASGWAVIWSVDGNGKNGKATSFDGVDDFMDTGNPINLNFWSGSFTLSSWVKSSSWADSCGIMSKWATIDSVAGYALRQVGTGSFQLVIGDGVTRPAVTVPGFNTGNWYHIAGIVDRTNNVMKLYVNGSSVASKNIASLAGSVTNNSFNWVIGRQSQFFNGSIDEVRIYNRALSDSEIQTLYNATK